MAKGAPKGKSSASSATRKKQASKVAKKAALERDENGNLLHPELAEALEKSKQPGQQRGQKKDKVKNKDAKGGKKGKSDKKKQFIPPPKPPQPLPDPLDSMGLASLLPADLVVLLRKASKKDVITRCRALEGVLVWIEDAIRDSPHTSADSQSDAEAPGLSPEERREALVMMLPCWVHLFPRLALSPARRLRLLTVQIHSLLLQAPKTSSHDIVTTRSELLESPQYVEPILGPLAILCHDTDRTIERLGRALWKAAYSWQTITASDERSSYPQLNLLKYLSTILSHLQTILLSPSPSFALSMTSAHAVSANDHATSRSVSGYNTPINGTSLERDAKTRDESNVEEDTSALDKRLVAGALSVLSSIVMEHPDPKSIESVTQMLSTRLVWSSLSPIDLFDNPLKKPRKEASTTSFGFDAPAVRVRAWALLRSVTANLPNVLDDNLEIIGTVAMTAAWQERDSGVQRSMLDAILPLLKGRPHLWLVSEGTKRDKSKDLSESDGAEEEDDDDEEDEENDGSDDDDDNDEDSSELLIKANENQGKRVDPLVSDTVKEKAIGAQKTLPQTLPRSYVAFLQWLQSACGGGPVLGYPAVVVFVSTIPAEILPPGDFEASSSLLSQFYSALYSRSLDNDTLGSRAFFSAYNECVTYLAVRMSRSGLQEESVGLGAELARVHLATPWREVVLNITSLQSIISPSAVEDDDAKARLQRIKHIGSSKIVSDLCSQLRRLAAAAPDLSLVGPLLKDIEDDIINLSRAAMSTQRDDISREDLLLVHGCFDRAVAVLTGLLHPSPTANQHSGSGLQLSVSGLIHRTLKVIAELFVDVSVETTQSVKLKRCRTGLLSELMSLLLKALVCSPDKVDAIELQQLEHVASVSIPQLTASRGILPAAAATFLAAYLPVCPTSEVRESIWTETLSSVAQLSTTTDQVEALSELLTSTSALKSLGTHCANRHIDLPVPAPEAGVAELMMTLVFCLCDSGDLQNTLRAQLRDVVSRILASPKPFIDERTADSMLTLVSSTIEQLRNVLLEKPSDHQDSAQERTRATLILPDLLDCLDSWVKAQAQPKAGKLLLSSQTFRSVIAVLCDLALLVPATIMEGSEGAIAEKAACTWAFLIDFSQPSDRALILQEGLTSLQDHLMDIQVPVTAIVTAAQRICSDLPDHSLLAVLPDPKELQEMLSRAARKEAHPALLVFDPLVSQCIKQASETGSTDVVDVQGLGTFARVCLAIALFFEQDRSLARSHVSLLPHIILFAILVEDDLLLNGASKHTLITAASPKEHQLWLQRSVAVASSLLSSVGEAITENWHSDMVSILQRNQPVDASKDGFGHILVQIWQMGAMEPDSSYLARIFYRMLKAAFSIGFVNESNADRWLKLGESAQDKVPHLSRAIYFASKGLAGASPTYDRLRNTAAAKLGGIEPSTSPESIMVALRNLVAVAPAADSELPLIPQQRAIFLMKDLQKWYASDEAADSPDEEAGTRLAEIFIHLLPVVQEVQGSHIDFIFDIIETNLEFGSLNQEESVAQLYVSLQLLETLRDLALRNRNLRDYWNDRRMTCLQLVRDHFLSLADDQMQGDSYSASSPSQACAELIVDLIREVPSTSFNLQKTAAPLCKLMLQHSSHDVQVVSYRLLSIAIKDHVKELVVETAVNKDALSTDEGHERLQFPEALLANVSGSLVSQLNLMVEEEAARRIAFGYFLSWIAVFDHFEEASLSIKSAFVEALEKRGLLTESLLPTVFSLVGLADEGRRLFDPSRYVIEEVFLDQVEAASSLTVLQVVATHVYLRALIHLPTTVRSWWVDIKDRQFSMQISSFTTRHCSPVIAARELSHLREPEALAKLQDEALSIKILSTNEVIATYVVDDHPMEIGVRIPADFPLHGVEIRDIQRVGITEAKWRFWLLAVQQLITGQNGLIFDALSLFKHNAEVQFQGLEECAICYSIISPMDRSLPTKPCKTCKNKFHGGCLYKWISTSGSSTCPLCRSIL